MSHANPANYLNRWCRTSRWMVITSRLTEQHDRSISTTSRPSSKGIGDYDLITSLYVKQNMNSVNFNWDSCVSSANSIITKQENVLSCISKNVIRTPNSFCTIFNNRHFLQIQFKVVIEIDTIKIEQLT